MQLRYFFFLPAFLVACNSSSDKSESGAASKQTVTDSGLPAKEAHAINGHTGEDPDKQSNGFWQRLVMNELRDQNGVISAVMPMPASWKFTRAGRQGDPSITGPNGIKVTDYPAKNFMINYNPSLQQSYNMAGQRMRAFPGVEQLVQQDFVPGAQQQGYQLVKYYEIPEVSKMDKWYSDQLFKAMPSRSDVVAIGTDWKNAEGKSYFMLIHLNVSTSNAMQTWWYMASGLEAEQEYFDAARRQLIFSLANMRYNLEPIAKYNQQEAQRVGQSWAAFNQRMAQNQAAFEASQRAFVNKSNAINDAIMNGWRERNAASDKQQERTVDAIYERTNVQDAETGERYKVTAGANQYWMNNNGEYISTQMNSYDPNLDDNMNEQRWKQLQEIKN